MKRLDTLLETVLDEIVQHVKDYAIDSNTTHENIIIYLKSADLQINFNVSIEYDYSEAYETGRIGVELTNITLNSAHVTKITTDLQSDLPNVRKLLNEKLINYENKNLPL